MKIPILASRLFPAGLGSLALTFMGGYLAINPPYSPIARGLWIAAFILIFLAEVVNTRTIEANAERKSTDLLGQLERVKVEQSESRVILGTMEKKLTEMLQRPSEAEAVADKIVTALQKESDAQVIASAYDLANAMRTFEKQSWSEVFAMIAESQKRWEASQGLPPMYREHVAYDYWDKSIERNEKMEIEFRETFAQKAAGLRDELLRRIRRKKPIADEWHIAFSGFYVFATEISDAADYLDKLANELKAIY